MRKIRSAFWGLLILALVFSVHPSVAQKQWYPFPVDVWEPAMSASATVTQDSYVPLEQASQPWRICVSTPHLKDPWWMALNYGVFQEAERLGVALNYFEAGGYENLEVQISQIKECLAEDPDGVLLSAVEIDRLNPVIDEIVARGIPVTDYINGVSSPQIAARTVRPYFDLATEAGRYLTQLIREETWTRNARVAWFPGPRAAGWAISGNEGLIQALAGSPVDIVGTYYGDTGRTQQGMLVEQALAEHDTIDFIVGTAITAEAAIRILSQRSLSDRIRVISYYYSPGVHRAIQRGVVLGASSDNPAIQGRIGLDQLVRILEGRPVMRQVAAKMDFVTTENVDAFDTYRALPPFGYRPQFVINWTAKDAPEL